MVFGKILLSVLEAIEREIGVKYNLLILLMIISAAGSSRAQVDGYMEIKFTSWNQDLVLTDGQGRRCGVDPKTGANYDEIPNIGYGQEGITPIDDASETSSIRSVGLNTIDYISDPLFHENYTVQVIGKRAELTKGTFRFQQTDNQQEIQITKTIVLDSLQSITYKVFYTTDSTQPPTVTKVVDAAIFRQDINNCYTLNLLPNSTLFQNLLQEVRKIDSCMKRSDTAASRIELHRLDILLDRLSGDTTEIKTDGYQILKEDVNVLSR